MTGAFDATSPTCTCLPPWPVLTTVIEGTCYTVVPVLAHTPASALYLARCGGCGAPYARPWRRLTNVPHAPDGADSVTRLRKRLLVEVAVANDVKDSVFSTVAVTVCWEDAAAARTGHLPRMRDRLVAGAAGRLRLHRVRRARILTGRVPARRESGRRRGSLHRIAR